MSIIFYDIPSTSPGYSVSPNTWRTRYCLNLKGLPYTTEWVEFPDIKTLYEKLGVPPTSKTLDGNPHYTLPMIYDPSTQRYISDSLAIAQYLDAQYPGTAESGRGTIFPSGSAGVIQNFAETAIPLMMDARYLITWTLFRKLNPSSATYYRALREATFGMKMEELVPDDKLVNEIATLEGIMKKIGTLHSNANKGEGTYLVGDVISWGDIMLAAVLVIFRISWGEDSELWKQLTSWHDGRWAKLMESMNRYE